ncbi:MAG TPA: uracil-DNA glycosylase [Parvularculaceae bacterium]|nr:uracil-DNA glycosylase [Parvularculaceae bacterium]HNS86206.1 uracil-DNA glycosylase [Parvularculaceae bacterium]
MREFDRSDAARALLRWYVDAGVDEAVDAEPVDRFQPEASVRPAPPARTATASVTHIARPAQPSADEAIARAAAAAAACNSHDELAAAVAAFEGCPLKAGARNTVFSDGVPGARLLVIGEAPGRDEDALGKPFVGRAGQLLDKMLAAIGRSRATDTLISNVVYWRPPGNRAPTQAEIAACRPFVERLIELTQPAAIMLAGGVPTQAMIGASGIMRARGAWRDVTLASGAAFPALPVFHPAFLLRQPAQKRLAWTDLQTLAARLRDA